MASSPHICPFKGFAAFEITLQFDCWGYREAFWMLQLWHRLSVLVGEGALRTPVTTLGEEQRKWRVPEDQGQGQDE